MSLRNGRFGRGAFSAVMVVGIVATVLVVRFLAVAAPPPGTSVVYEPEGPAATAPTFTIGPIDGLTTTWHWAPHVTSIPLGTTAQFFQPAEPDSTVIWNGATEVDRDDEGSTAVCPLVELGSIVVQVEVIPVEGEMTSSQSVLNVVDIQVGEIMVSIVDTWVDLIDIDEALPQEEINELTTEYFFDYFSIAALRELGAGQYRTSVKRPVHARIRVDPPGVAPLMEWRFDGQPVDAPPVVGAPGPPGSMAAEWNSYGVGLAAQRMFAEVGNHSIEVGPIFGSAEIEIETYSVTITSHTSGEDIVREGEPVTFFAETDPPGYEDEITWLSSTKYGTAEPILGAGPTFVVEFNDTWGPWPIDPAVPFQWLGVKADNAVFNQDQKERDDECGHCLKEKDSDGTPVYLFSGEHYESFVDLTIRGVGMDFTWSRKYRSKIGPDTVQGNGWDCSYNIRIQPDGNNFILFDGNTRQDTYVGPPGGPWAAPEFFRVLSLNEDESYTLEFADTSTWHFLPFDGSPQQGKISSIIDRNENTISFEYDGQGRLVTITDTLDRDITVQHNGDGLVESITDFMGRQVHYEYYQDGDADGSSGDLKSVTTPEVNGTPNGNDFPNGKTTIFTYSTGFDDEALNHNLLTITDPKGQLYVTNIYADSQDSSDFLFDRVVRQIWGNPGDIMDFVYIPLVPTEENNFADTKVIVNDRVGNVEEHLFNALNVNVNMREFTGRADPDQPTTETDNRPVNELRPEDPPFFETQWEHGTDTLATRIIHPNGNIEEFVYDHDNDNRRSQGNLLQHCRLPGPLGGDQEQICEEFEYDDEFGGCCGTNFIIRHVDARGNETLHEYDEFGNRTHTQHRIPSIVEDFEYEGFGRQISARVLPDNGSNHRRRDEFTYYDSGPQLGYLEQEIIDVGGFELTTTYVYDDLGRALSVTDPEGHETQYVYNELDQVVRKLSAEVDLPNGAMRYERDTFYDANDNVARIDIQNIDDQGVVQNNTHFSMIYDFEILDYRIRMAEEVGDVNLASSVLTTDDIPGQDLDDFILTDYEYDENRNRTLVEYGEATNGNDRFNRVRTLYDERDLVFRAIRAAGDSDESTDQYDYDSNRNLKRTSQGLEDTPRIMVNTYDGYDRQVLSVDPMGNVSESHYDPNSNLGGEVDPVNEPGVFHPFAMRTSGELIDVEGSAGNIRLSQMMYFYDPMDRLIREEVEFFDTETQDPIMGGQELGKAITETEFTDNSQIRLVTDDNLHETLTEYDTANRVLTVTDAKGTDDIATGNTVTFTYDDDSLVEAVIEVEKSDLDGMPDPVPDEEFTTTNAYDAIHRLISTMDNLGNTEQDATANTHTFGYDSRDNQTVMTDALEHETRYVYDGINRLTDTIRDLDDDGADGNGDDIVTTQTWDDTSRLESQADDNGNTTTYVYDALNRMTAEDYADCTQHIYSYDVHDNWLTMIDANGSEAECTYDLLDRLIIKDIEPGPGVSDDTTFEIYKYDGLSRLVHAKDNDSVVTRSYDSLSRMTRETSNGQTTSCVYDGVGNQTQCTYPGGRIISCTYDELDRKKVISDSEAMIAEYDYVGPGRVEQRDFGNDTRCEYKYDGITGSPNEPGDFGVKMIVRTTHSKIADATIIDDRTYTWDEIYNKTQRQDVRDDGPELTHDYTYDSIYRLVRTVVTDPTPTVFRDTDYDLDGVGNREEVLADPDPGMDAGPYFLDPTLCEPGDFQMNQYTTTPFDERTYDQNGNLIGLSDPGDPPPMGAVTYDYRNQMISYVDPTTSVMAQYAYDPLGRRISRTVNGGTTRYFYEDSQVVEEQGQFGVTEATYVYGLYVDEALNMQRAGLDYYYHTDDLYNVMAVTDAAGAVIETERHEYGDYGQPVDRFTLDPIEVPGDPSTIGNPYLFTGRRYDPETGWYYYRTRYLNPIAGRFTTRDTMGLWWDPMNEGNGYEYVGSNPLTFSDPSGMAGKCEDTTVEEEVEETIECSEWIVFSRNKIPTCDTSLAACTLQALRTRAKELKDLAQGVADDFCDGGTCTDKKKKCEANLTVLKAKIRLPALETKVWNGTTYIRCTASIKVTAEGKCKCC